MQVKSQNYQKLRKYAIKEGAALFGVAELSKVKTDDFLISQSILTKLPYAISIGNRLSSIVLEEIEDHPTKNYFHHYRQVNNFLDQLALKVSRYIENLGYNAYPIAASQLIDWQNQRGQLSHKRIGVAAGLGWIGRNNLLVNNKLGSQFRLVTILTDLPLVTDKTSTDMTLSAADCGDCQKCISVCPAQAIHEKPEDFEHVKCFEKLKEFQKKGYTAQYICGVCVKVCNGKK